MSNKQLEELLSQLKLLSEQTLKNLESMDEDDLLRFVDKRVELANAIEPLKAQFTNEHRQVIATMIAAEQGIVDKMYTLRNEAGDGLLKQNAARAQQKAYHQAFQVDSLFIDHRK